MAPVLGTRCHRDSIRLLASRRRLAAARCGSRFASRLGGTPLCALVVSAAALCTACGGLPPLPPYPGGARPASPLGLADDRPADGSLRPGDELIVESGSGDQRRQVRGRVDSTGELHVDSNKDVPVAGLSLALAEARVAQELRRSDKFAEVDLMLANRAAQRVTVLGALARPGPIEAGPLMRVADVVAAAGGILIQEEAGGLPALEVGDLDRAALVRNGTALPIDMREALRARPGHNVYVHPGDLLYVPFATTNTVSVFGQVNTPRMLPHRSGMRLTEALAAAGGLTTGAAKGDIRLVRGSVEAPRAFQASLAGIADGEQNDAMLAPGDVVFVEDSFFEDAGEILALAAPLGALALLTATLVILGR
jgi:polysaccharide export outer membrane protein